MKEKTRALALTAILIAITLVLGLLPIGFITIPGFIEITLMCIPVLVGTLVLGWRVGLPLGALFALTSIIVALSGRSVLGTMLLEDSIVKTLVLLIVPRLLIPLVAFLIYRVMRAKKDALNIAVAGAAGSVTNTVVFLVMLNLMFPDLVAGQVFTFAAFINGAAEAVLAALVCPPIVKALKKSVPPLERPKEKTA